MTRKLYVLALVLFLILAGSSLSLSRKVRLEPIVIGSAIEKLCECAMEESLTDRGSVVRAARCLLGSVTRVLLLADIVVVKQLLLAKDRVARSLGRLESVTNFTEFVKAFSQFGAEMVELAHLTGDRQVSLQKMTSIICDFFNCPSL